MNPDILKPAEENLFSLATEMGLVVMTETTASEQTAEKKQEIAAVKPKPFSQLT